MEWIAEPMNSETNENTRWASCTPFYSCVTYIAGVGKPCKKFQFCVAYLGN